MHSTHYGVMGVFVFQVTNTVLHGSLQAGTPVPLLGSQSQSQAAALTPLPLQQGQPQHAALQEEKLKVGGASSVETVKAVLSLSTLSVPSSQQQSLAPGSQPFDLGSGQKVGYNH